VITLPAADRHEIEALSERLSEMLGDLCARVCWPKHVEPITIV
jgi:hypothetical protein